MSEEKRLTYKLPFGITATVYSHYINGFKPYPVTLKRCRFLKIQWLVRSGKRGTLIRYVNGNSGEKYTKSYPLYKTKSIDIFLYRIEKFTFEKK
jgi:hypothetical protein